MGIGVDLDQYNTDPEAQSTLITSAQKNVDVAVYNYLKTVADGSVKASISTATLQNGGVGLACMGEILYPWRTINANSRKTQ